MKALAVLTVFVLAAACGSEADPGGEPTSAGPQDAVKQLVTSLEAGDCAAVKDIVVTPATVDCEMVQSLAGSFADEGIELAEVTYTPGDIVDGSGSVSTDWGNGDPDDSWQVERVDGAWKVIFDSVE